MEFCDIIGCGGKPEGPQAVPHAADGLASLVGVREQQ